MGLDFKYIDGQTPLSEEEKEGLLIKSITTRGELDELEQLNIEKAIEWTLSNKFVKEKILSEKFIKSVHKRMFGDVWGWAGKFRMSEKNIGVDWMKIGVELRTLLDDANYWIKNHTYPPDEITNETPRRKQRSIITLSRGLIGYSYTSFYILCQDLALLHILISYFHHQIYSRYLQNIHLSKIHHPTIILSPLDVCEIPPELSDSLLS
jgi:hypothetical protein